MRNWIRFFFITTLIFGFSACSYLPDDVDNWSSFKETSKYIAIQKQGNTALLFYPGGLVDPNAYKNFCSRIAEELNITVVIAKMPVNLAVIKKNAANDILKDFDQQNWIFSGHSLGGVMISDYLSENQNEAEVLIYCASYPGKEISNWGGTVLAFRGSRDGLVSKEDVISRSESMPVFLEIDDTSNLAATNNTYYIEIDGGNHSNFGNYGLQDGDNSAVITDVAQQNTVVRFLGKIIEEKGW